jgi:sulfide dehydrogenase cytochrome subunit
MKYKKLSGAVMLLAGGLMLGVPAQALDRGTMLANTCVGCHGPAGASTGPATPSIGGMAEDTFVEGMKAYQEGRAGTIMDRIAKGYTAEELKLMGEYFAKQKFVPAAQEADADKAAKGAKLHEEYCDKCHEEKGTVDKDGSSILAGQWKPYMDAQLADFHSGKRDMGKKMAKRMKAMVEDKGEGAFDEISHFYASHK